MALEIILGEFLKQKAEIMVIPTSREDPCFINRVAEKVFKAAGYTELCEARRKFGKLNYGDIVVTPGFDLDVKYIIHACIRPYWVNSNMEETKNILKQCYSQALQWAEESNAESISFTPMGVGLIPKTMEKIATDTIEDHLRAGKSDLNVFLIIPLSYDLFYPVVEGRPNIRRSAGTGAAVEKNRDIYTDYNIRFEEKLRDSGMTREDFCRDYVMNILTYRIINADQLAKTIEYDRVAVYRFRNGKILKPKKNRVIAMAIAMGLSDEERCNFIRCVGYKYPYEERDYIVEKLMRSGIVDYERVNSELCRINPELTLSGKRSRDNHE